MIGMEWKWTLLMFIIIVCPPKEYLLYNIPKMRSPCIFKRHRGVQSRALMMMMIRFGMEGKQK